MAEYRDKPKEFEERVINIDRVARVVKGGRRFRFRATVIVGDKKGRVGMGIAKASDVTGAISKAVSQATKSLITVPLFRHGTLPFESSAKFRGAHVLLKPAGPGTGVIAGGAVRDIMEVSGISDVLSKSLGSSNKINIGYATLKALDQLIKYSDMHPRQAKTAGPAKKVTTTK